jgi:two-component system, NtrC family, response regulator AtoC
MNINDQIEFNLNVLKLMHNRPNLKVSEKAKEKLGRFRGAFSESQLADILEKALLVCQNDQILPEDLTLPQVENKLGVPVGLKLEAVERQYILQTLYFVEQNRTKAADILGISIRTLRNKLQQYRIEGYL